MKQNLPYLYRLRPIAVASLSLSLLLATTASADDKASSADEQTTVAEKQDETRVGTCEDAKAQTKYWCEERESVTVVSFGLECENAKKNAMEACEGIKSQDQPYQFDTEDSARE